MAGMAAYLASIGQHYGIPGMGVAEVFSALYGLGMLLEAVSRLIRMACLHLRELLSLVGMCQVPRSDAQLG